MEEHDQGGQQVRRDVAVAIAFDARIEALEAEIRILRDARTAAAVAPVAAVAPAAAMAAVAAMAPVVALAPVAAVVAVAPVAALAPVAAVVVPAPVAAHADEAPAEANSETLEQLVAMGFSRDASAEALSSHAGDAGVAVAYMLASGVGEPPVSDVQTRQLQAMGFTGDEARAALDTHGGHLERALEALLTSRDSFSASSSSSSSSRPAVPALAVSSGGKVSFEADSDGDFLPASPPRRESDRKRPADAGEGSESSLPKRKAFGPVDGAADVSAAEAQDSEAAGEEEPEAAAAPEVRAPEAGGAKKPKTGGAKGKAKATAKTNSKANLTGAVACLRPALVLVAVVFQGLAARSQAVQIEELLDLEKKRWKGAAGGARFGRVFDDCSFWLMKAFEHSNAELRADIASAQLEFPPLLAKFIGVARPDWGRPQTWKNIIRKLKQFYKFAEDSRSQQSAMLWLFSPYLHSPASFANGIWKEGTDTMELLMDIARKHPDLFEEVAMQDGISCPKSTACTLNFQGKSAIISDHQIGPLNPTGRRRTQDIKEFIGPSLNLLQSLWPHMCMAWRRLKLVEELEAVVAKSRAASLPTLGESCCAAEIMLYLGVLPGRFLASFGGPQEWKEVADRHTAVGEQRPVLDPEMQLQALCALGLVEKRSCVSAEEKEGEIGLAEDLVLNKASKRVFWFCEGCDKWFDQRDAAYRKDNSERSSMTRHRCGLPDCRNPGEVPSVKPRMFEIVKGRNLGLSLEAKAAANGSNLVHLSLHFPVEQIWQHLEFAAGPSDRFRAELRVASVDEADAEVAEAEAEEGDDDEEEPGKSADGDEETQVPEEQEQGSQKRSQSGGPAAKRRRSNAEAEVAEKALAQKGGQPLMNTTGQKLVRLQRFNLLGCKDLPGAPAQPAGLQLPLHPIQQRTLFWMATREGARVDGFTAEQTAFAGFASVQKLGRRLGASDVSVQLRVERFYEKAKGGLLADAVGYGKTASVLGLVALTRSPEVPQLRDVGHQKGQQHHIASRATLVMVPPNLHDQWKGEVGKFLPKDFQLVSISTFKDVKRVTVGELRAADLVLVSTRLLVSKAYQEHVDALAGLPSAVTVEITGKSRWEQAYQKWLSKKQRFRAKCQLGLHQDAPDPGPAPQQSDFKDVKEERPADVTSARLTERSEKLRRLVAELLGTCKDVDALEGPSLEMFHWQRLVVDELHEPLRAMRGLAEIGEQGWKPDKESRWLFHTLESLKASARWGLTATPNLSSAQQVSLLARFHRVFVPRDSDLEAQHYLDEYVRSNDVQLAALPITFHLLPVRHTARERALYLNLAKSENPDPSKLLQICNFFSPDGVDADMGAAVMTTRRENEAALDQHRKEMQKAAHERGRLEREAARGFPSALDEAERRKMADKLKRLVDGRRLAEEKERRTESRMKYFEEVLLELQKLEQEAVQCPVCMEDLAPERCMVTRCGHLFCKDCIESWVKERSSCPTCVQPIRSAQPAAEVLACEREGGANVGRVSKFGSKLQAVCEQLDRIWKDEPGAKTIIFVQFEVLLKKLEGALKDSGLPCLTLRGGIFERRRIIRQFQSGGDQNKVLLLSLEKSPSGMNLVCCHHLLLVHPMQ
ncbi:unnamed protein product, partial [Polarella glacialis]